MENQQQGHPLVPLTYGKRTWFLWGALIIKVAISYVVTFAAEMVYLVSYAYQDMEGFMKVYEDQKAMTELMVEMTEVLLAYTTPLEGIAALITVPILYFMFRSDRKKEKMYGFTQPKKAPIGKYSAIVLISAAMCVGVNNLFYITGIASMDQQYTEITEAMYSASFGMEILCLGILIPIAEELVFRGLMYRRLRYTSTYLQAGLYSAIAFSIFHGNMVQMIYAFVLGMLFAYLYEKYGSVKAPIAAHIMMNLVSVTATEYHLMEWMSAEYMRIGTITVICAAIASTMFVLIQRMED